MYRALSPSVPPAGVERERIAAATNFAHSQLASSGDCPPYSAVAVGAVQRASPSRRKVTSAIGTPARHDSAFRSLCRVRAEGRGLDPPGVRHIDEATGPVG